MGGLLGDVVLAEAGFDELFLTAAASAFGALIISLWLPERTPALEDTGAKTEYSEAIRRPDLLAIWFIIGAFSLVLNGYFTFLRTFIDEVGIGSVGLFFAFYAGTAIALRLAFAWLPARVVRRRPSALALAAAVVMAAATVIYWHWDRRYDYEDGHEDVPAPAG